MMKTSFREWKRNCRSRRFTSPKRIGNETRNAAGVVPCSEAGLQKLAEDFFLKKIQMALPSSEDEHRPKWQGEQAAQQLGEELGRQVGCHRLAAR
jgi:hypothetical protein